MSKNENIATSSEHQLLLFEKMVFLPQEVKNIFFTWALTKELSGELPRFPAPPLQNWNSAVSVPLASALHFASCSIR